MTAQDPLGLFDDVSSNDPLGLFSDLDKPKQQELGTQMIDKFKSRVIGSDPLGDILRGTKDTAASLVDIVAGVPKMMAAGGGAALLGGMAALRGDPVDLNAAMDTTSEAVERYVPSMQSSVNRMTGTDTGMAGKAMMAPFEAIGHGIETGANKLSEITGNQNVGGGAKIAANVFAPFIGIPGAKFVGKKLGGALEDSIAAKSGDVQRAELGYGSLAAQKIKERRAQKEAESVSGKEAPTQQTELDLGYTNQFGHKPSEFTVDENGIPIRRDASIEHQTTERGGDLFSQENIKQQGISENLANWELSDQARGATPDRDYLRQQEIEQAYQQKAKQDAEAPVEPLQEPQQRFLDIESPQERTTHRPNSQRGSLDLRDQRGFNEFSDMLRNELPDVTSQEIRTAWEEQQVGKKKANEYSNKAAALSKMGLDGDKIVIDSLKPDDVLTVLQHTDDSVKDQNFYEKYGMSQGYMVAEASRNPAVKLGVRYLKSMFDKNARKASNALFAQESTGTPGIIHALNKMELFGGRVKEGADLFKQMFEAKGNPDYMFDLTPRQQRVKDLIDSRFDTMRNEINQWLPEGKQMDQIPNYIPSVHSGKFYGTASMRKADGTLTKPLLFSAETLFGANRIKDKLAKQGYVVSNTKTRGHTKNDFGDSSESKAANYQYYLETMGEGSAELKQLYSAISREMQRNATTTRGHHNRQKTWHGFEGAAGDRPWLSDKQNYYDAKKMLIDVVESHYAWLSAQEGAAFGRAITDPKNKVPENNRNILQNYLETNIIGNRFSDGISRMSSDFFTSIGVDPKLANRISSVTGNTVTAMLTAFGSPVHALTNVLQPMTVILPQMLLHAGLKPVDMTKAMATGAFEFSTMFLGKQATEIGKVLGFDEITIKRKSAEAKEKQQYAEGVGIIDPTIVDSTPVFNNKTANAVHQFAMQGILSKPSEQAARWTVFSTMADFYRANGMSKQEAFTRAREVTETYMVDYGPDAKANGWKALGGLNQVLGRLQTFATNQFSQLYTYGKNATQSPKEAGAFLTYLGTLYFLGGMAGMPGFDVLEEMVNRVASKDGHTYSLRNELRRAVGDTVYSPFDNLTGLGMSPTFGSRILSSSKDGGIGLSALSMPVVDKVGQVAEVAGRRLSPSSPSWGEETEAEKGRELQTILPVAARGMIEDAYLKPTVGGQVRNVSPNTGKPLHTQQPNELSFGNIRSTERAKDTELSSEQFKETRRFKEDKMAVEKELTSLAHDVNIYGNGSDMKSRRFTKKVQEYLKNYAASEQELNSLFEALPEAYYQNTDIAALARLGKKSNASLDDVRKILFHKKYEELR